MTDKDRIVYRAVRTLGRHGLKVLSGYMDTYEDAKRGPSSARGMKRVSISERILTTLLFPTKRERM